MALFSASVQSSRPQSGLLAPFLDVEVPERHGQPSRDGDIAIDMSQW